jgi:hypothetical protein
MVLWARPKVSKNLNLLRLENGRGVLNPPDGDEIPSWLVVAYTTSTIKRSDVVGRPMHSFKKNVVLCRCDEVALHGTARVNFQFLKLSSN